MNPIVLVYVGAAYWAQPNKKVVHGYAEVDGWPDAPVLGGTSLRFFGKPLQKGRPGTVISVERVETAPDAETERVKVHSIVGQWPDRQDRLRWQAAHDANLAEAAARRREAKMLSDNVLQASLEPIRTAYRNAGPNTRRHMLALVLEYITR